jgi:hypothetical protein
VDDCPVPGYRYFAVVRADETCDDFSFRKCVDVLFPGFAKQTKKTKTTRNYATALNARISRVGLALHSRVSLDWLHGPYRLSSIEPCFDCTK